MSRLQWRFSEKRNPWWYLLPLTGWMVFQAVQEHGIQRLISALLAALGLVLVAVDLVRAPRNSDANAPGDNE